MRLSLFAMPVTVLLAATGAHAGERPMVEVNCEPTDKKLTYMCMFNVMGMKSHKPIDGAEFKVNADMASMPMAHNVPPMRPKPTGKPGSYHGMLELEMVGEWTLKMEFKKPARDVVVKSLTFGPSGTKTDHAGHGDHSKSE